MAEIKAQTYCCRNGLPASYWLVMLTLTLPPGKKAGSMLLYWDEVSESYTALVRCTTDELKDHLEEILENPQQEKLYPLLCTLQCMLPL